LLPGRRAAVLPGRRAAVETRVLYAAREKTGGCVVILRRLHGFNWKKNLLKTLNEIWEQTKARDDQKQLDEQQGTRNQKRKEARLLEDELKRQKGQQEKKQEESKEEQVETQEESKEETQDEIQEEKQEKQLMKHRD
jgi:hypothetical protein